MAFGFEILWEAHQQICKAGPLGRIERARIIDRHHDCGRPTVVDDRRHLAAFGRPWLRQPILSGDRMSLLYLTIRP